MKKLIALLALAATCVAGKAQDTNAVSTLWDFLTAGSNYWTTVYASSGLSGHSIGGGIELGYHISDLLNPVIRGDYFGNQVYMVSGNMQLQVPRQFMGKIPVYPYAEGGVGMPLGGLGQQNGTPVEIAGTGAYFSLAWIGKGWFFQNVELKGGYEHWFGVPAEQQNRAVLGLHYQF